MRVEAGIVLDGPRRERPLARVPTGAIAARRRPWAVLTLFAWEALLGLFLGSSLASLASGAYARHPDGDAPLFAPDGLALLDLVRHSAAARGPLLCALLATALAARLGGVVPGAVVFAELAFARRVGHAWRSPTARDVAARVAAALPATLGLALLTLALESMLLLVGLGAAGAAAAWATGRLGERGADGVELAVALTAVMAAALVGVGGDLARADVVRNDSPALSALETSAGSLARRPRAILWSAGWRAAAGAVPLAIAALLSAHVASRSATAVLVLGGVQQLALAARVGVRVSWMAKALRVVSRA